MRDYIEQYIQGAMTFEELVEHAVEELYQSGCGPELEAAERYSAMTMLELCQMYIDITEIADFTEFVDKVYETATSETDGM